LTFLALLGVVLAVGLVSNASLFAQAVDQVILNRELEAFSEMTERPPFSTSVYTFPSGRTAISLPMAEDLATEVANALSSEVGLPLEHLGMQVHSGNLMLQPTESSAQYGEDFLGSVDVAYIADVTDQMEIISGEPMDPEGASGEILDVWMHTRLAETMGINVGEELQLNENVSGEPERVQIAGIWQAADAEDDYWFEDPDATLRNVFLVRRQDYIDRIQPLVPKKTWYLSWHVILDGSRVYPEDAQSYLEGFSRAEVVISKFLPEARINTPPLDPLESFVTRGDTLTILLLGFNLPALGFLIYFLVLSSAIIAQWQQRETAMLVSRGMRATSILAQTFIEEIILFIIGYPLGVGAGMLLARLMGQTSSFLTFVSREPLPVHLRGLNVPLTLMALFVALMARLIPAARATRLSAKDVDRERARPVKGPFWYRAYLDFLLILPTYYAWRQLTQRGSISMLVEDAPTDLYRDPLLILVPALFILTGALMTLRIFPLIMKGLDFIANLIPWPTPHLALRQLGRRSTMYINPLLLVIVSLALGVYTISMAASLDQWLIDRMYYRSGSQLSFGVYPITATSSASATIVSGEWIPQPANFESVDGIRSATRVGEFSMSSELPASGKVRGRFLAVDRLKFPQVAWFREDFARGESLGALMNRLALSPNSILVSEEILEDNPLEVGDDIVVQVSINYESFIRTNFKIVGTYNYFPTVYEDDAVTFIGNLEHLSFFMGLVPPHNIWVQLEDGADGEQVIDQIPQELGVNTRKVQDVNALVNEELAKLERVGVFGTLSVGFLAAVVMAIMGLLIYTYASLQDRLHRLTILRAVGLLRRQISGQVVLEYAFLTAYGSIAGAVIGSIATNMFVPLFRVTAEEGVPLPPLVPIIAEEKVQLMVISFVGLIVALELFVIVRALSRRAFSMLKGVFG
jgi:putative ABC transport system permease protein